MFNDVGLTDYENRFLSQAVIWGMRVLRGIVYFIISMALIAVNTYGVGHTFLLSLVIGAMGAGAATSRIALVAIAALLAMAVFPASVIDAITTAAF